MPPSHSGPAPRKRRGAGVFTLILATALAVVLLWAGHDQAQGANLPTVYVFSYQTGVKMGDDATFIFYRTGELSDSLVVDAQYREYGIGGGPDDIGALHDLPITFPAGSGTVEWTHNIVVDMHERHNLLLVVLTDGNDYDLGNSEHSLSITRSASDPLDTFSNLHGTYLGITAAQSSVTEGAEVAYTVTRDGDLSEELTVDVVIGAPRDLLLGNLWEHPGGPIQGPMLSALSICDIPENSNSMNPIHIPMRALCSYQTSVTFAPNESSKTLTVQTRDDFRDIPDTTLSAALLDPDGSDGHDYRVGSESKAGVTVLDNDTVSTLELTVDRPSTTEAMGRLTYEATWKGGPEGVSLIFWVEMSHSRVWEEDPEGNAHIVGVILSNEETFSERIWITDNLQVEDDWTYRANFQDSMSMRMPDGTDWPIPSYDLPEYVRVLNDKDVTATVHDTGTTPVVALYHYQSATRVGETATYGLYRTGDVSEPMSVEMEYPVGLRKADGTKLPGEAITFPAGSRTVETVIRSNPQLNASNSRIELRFSSGDDYIAGPNQWAWIHITHPEDALYDVTYPHDTYVGVTADQVSITEGDSVTYTVTRDGDLSEALTVDLAINDPGGVLEGDLWDTNGPIQGAGLAELRDCDIRSALETYSDPPYSNDMVQQALCSYQTSVTFAPQESSTTFTVETRPNLHDVSDFDSVLSAAVIGITMEGDVPYRVGTQAKADVAVVDNDEVPELTLSVNEPRVNEEFGVLEFWVAQNEVQIPGHTLAFTLRLEHDREWDDPNDTDWQMVPGSSPVRWYKEIPWEFAGAGNEFVETVAITDNLLAEPNWTYTSSLHS